MVAKDEGEFNYDEKSEKGPSLWGEIRPERCMSRQETMQSPIDLLNRRVEVVSHLGRLKRITGRLMQRERERLVQPHHT